MRGWKVDFDPTALKDFRKLPSRIQDEIQMVVEELLDRGPAIPGALELRRNNNSWRIHLAHHDYRIIYRVYPKQLIRITRIRHRDVAYRGLKG